jgi:predicted ester cyclase
VRSRRPNRSRTAYEQERRADAGQPYEDVFAAFDSPQLEFEDTLAAGDRVVIRFTMTGRHRGAFMGVPATGTDVALPGITILRFGEGGKAIERWSSADMLGLLVQLGAVPAPA